MRSWLNRVVKQRADIVPCMDYFEQELDTARAECKLYGSLEKASAALPGIVEQRFSQLQEIESILEFLNIELRRERSLVFRKFLETYNRQLSSRDAEKYVDGDAGIVALTQLINEFSLVRNNYLGIIKALESKSFQINNITRLRTAGLEDVKV